MMQPHSRDAEAVKKHAFHDQGVLVVDIKDLRIAWPERQILQGVGEKLYGKKPAGR